MKTRILSYFKRNAINYVTRQKKPLLEFKKKTKDIVTRKEKHPINTK